MSLRERMSYEPGDVVETPCNTCLNLYRGRLVGDSLLTMAMTCRAFPDGIPKAVIMGDVDHRTSIEGDRGILYDPDPARAPGRGG